MCRLSTSMSEYLIVGLTDQSTIRVSSMMQVLFIAFVSLLDFCLIEINSISNDAITLTCLLQEYQAVCRYRYYASIWIIGSSGCRFGNISKNVVRR